ncbi:hypothetical protein [Bradymonas sediminis]|uniref:Uncharacterized protein n=1 Tax=Bradymonas sediminis TaxID=1548548 RepID=A0A2Z4FJV8_9DELT|nr:hypothetical protein [Bradymonas sediminis]AWV89125.1 hypothetical protein DN745_07160 [Bradymonas sediminis]TDP64409.1 hypothetical protein DFR33_10970 [Bradymonas sediminis]
MSDINIWLDRLEDILAARRGTVTRDGEQLHVRFGRSLTAAEANINPSALWPVLECAPQAEHERLMQGFASGVHNVLLEPKRSKAKDWTYEEAAGTLFPNVEVFTFRLGAEAAGGAPWTLDFEGDLIVAYFFELNIGRRVLTQAQFDQWPATASRVTAAARSMLYHRSRDASPKPVEGFDGVEVIHVGDEYDAIRSIVVVDLFFGDFKDSFRFTMPSQDALLYVKGNAPEQIAALRAATDVQFEAADYPLSRAVYTFERGQPILDSELNSTEGD